MRQPKRTGNQLVDDAFRDIQKQINSLQVPTTTQVVGGGSSSINSSNIQYTGTFLGLKNLLPAALTAPVSIVVTNNITLTSYVETDLNGHDLEISFAPGVTVSSSLTDTGSYGTPLGLMRFHNTGGNIGTGRIILRNIRITGNTSGQSPVTSYLGGLVVRDIGDVTLEGVKVSSTPYLGAWVWGATTRFSVSGCEFANNLYGGISFTNCKNGVIEGNYCHDNGFYLPTYGYGISLTHQFGTGSDNDNILIQGNRCYRNWRKGIDVHGGMNIGIVKNHVKGFGYGGIYAVADGNNVSLHEQNVGNVTITENTVENDATWFNAFNDTPDANLDPNTDNWVGVHPIQVGANGYTGHDVLANVGYSRSNWDVSNNIIFNCDVNNPNRSIVGCPTDLKYLIHSFGAGANVISICANIINTANPLYSIYVGSGTAVSQPYEVEVSQNKILSNTATTGVLITCGQSVRTANNDFWGCTYSSDGVGVSDGVSYGAASSVAKIYYNNNNFYNSTYTLELHDATSAITHRDDGLILGRDPDTNTWLCGIGDSSIAREYGWDCDTSIRAKYDLIAGASGVASGRVYVVNDSGVNKIILDSGGGSSIGGDLGVDGHLNLAANKLYKIDGTQIGTGNLGDFPSQTGNSGKALVTDGSVLSWGTPTISWGSISSIPANVTAYAGSNLNLRSNIIEENVTNDLSAIFINYSGYNSGNTQFRNTYICDGKGNNIASFYGADKATEYFGNVSSSGYFNAVSGFKVNGVALGYSHLGAYPTNAVDTAGIVTAPTVSNADKVWKTDGSGVPGWRADANGDGTGAQVYQADLPDGINRINIATTDGMVTGVTIEAI